MPSTVSTLLGATTFLTLIAIDLRAAAAFDAPKRLIAMIGIAAAIVAFAFTRIERGPAAKRDRALIAVMLAAAFIVISALVSPRRAIALDSLRVVFLFAAVAILCALVPRAWNAIAFGFVAGAAVNAALSILQGLRWFEPIPYATPESSTSALIGNTGLLSLVCAFAALLIVPPIVRERRIWLIALFALLVVAMVVNRGLTAFAALVVGIAAIAVRTTTRPRVRYAVVAASIACTLAMLAAGAVRSDTTNWNRLLRWRPGAWLAGVEMFLDRPLTGFGPGTYASEFAPHITAAEARWRVPLANADTVMTGAYAEAHNDYVQSLAELGGPATLLLLFAAILSVAGLPRGDEESTTLWSIVVAGGVTALLWFPFLRPPTALLLLGAFGRAWRISRDAA